MEELDYDHREDWDEVLTDGEPDAHVWINEEVQMPCAISRSEWAGCWLGYVIIPRERLSAEGLPNSPRELYAAGFGGPVEVTYIGEPLFEHDDLPEDSLWFGFDYGGAADIVPNQRVEEVSDAIISSFAAIAGKTLNSMPRSYKSFEYAESQAEALAAYLCERFLLNGGRQ